MELLAPAGDKQKLIMAIEYGADAVYLASTRFGLRTFAGNFSEEELADAVRYAHEHGVKVYVTVNIIPHESDLAELPRYIEYLDSIDVDAIICADLGVISIARRVAPKLAIHVSTQANITNSESAMVYVGLGVKRLILAREMTLDEIRELRVKVPEDIELEAFCHGAMCISYSGRCLLSNFFTGRDANRGACVQACRWNYVIREISKDQEYPIEEDTHGSYILNSKDMCMIDHLDKLRDVGISSVKIEGRMKTEYYVANVVNAYRLALDYLSSHDRYDLPKEIRDEVYKSSHRDYSCGFYFGEPKENLDTSLPESTYDFVAVVLEDTIDGRTKVEMRNKFSVNTELELLSKTKNNAIIHIDKIEDMEGNNLIDCKVPKQVVYIYTDVSLKKLELLRRKK
ncbi:MAG: U32 family peptidase [Clostridiales bacterium]|nr:U32 family peptidase [Clostridiales bacterium]